MPTSKIEIKEFSVGKEIQIRTVHDKQYTITIHDLGDTITVQCGFGEKILIYPQSQDTIRLSSEF